VNQLNAVPDKDKGNSLILLTSVIPASLIWAKNCHRPLFGKMATASLSSSPG
jgi:hypothetical protein